MTSVTARGELRAKRKRRHSALLTNYIIPLFSFSAIIYFAVFQSNNISGYVTSGLELALRRVIPTAFPFMILSDLYISIGHPERLPFAGIFSFCFGLPPAAVGPYVCGNICGFPLGAKTAVSLYSSGKLDVEQTEKLCIYANSPSLPFVIGSIGVGIYGSIAIGVALYSSVILSGLVLGFVLKRKNQSLPSHHICTNKHSFDLIKSISDAGLCSITISAFITAASVIGGILESWMSCAPLVLLSNLTLEVTRGVEFLSQEGIATSLRLPLTAFTLAFGGFSVFMQSMSFINEVGFSKFKFICLKLLQGGIALLICFLLTPAFGISA